MLTPTFELRDNFFQASHGDNYIFVFFITEFIISKKYGTTAKLTFKKNVLL